MTIDQLLRSSASRLSQMKLGEVVDGNEEAVEEAYGLLGRSEGYSDKDEDVEQVLLVWLIDEMEQTLDALTWDEEKRADFRNWAVGWMEMRDRHFRNQEEGLRRGA
jgi:hypothetical protein